MKGRKENAEDKDDYLLKVQNMYLTNTGNLKQSKRTQHIKTPKFEIYWEGLIFYPGIKEGIPTVETLLNRIDSRCNPASIVEETKALRGNWCLFINDTETKTWLVCADHSHQSDIFFSKSAASTSFLELRSILLDPFKVSIEALVFMLMSGMCYSDHIMYEEISRLSHMQYLIVENNQISMHSKQIDDPVANAKNGDFGSFMNSFFSSLSNQNICLDLTGGTDTRSILILLNHFEYDFDIAVNGDKDSTEAVIATEVGKQIGKQVIYYNIDSNRVTAEDLKRCWRACDGLNIALGSYYFEVFRKAMGYTLVVTGRGGNMYKDDTFLRYAALYTLLLKNVRKLTDTLTKKGVMFWWGISVNELLANLSEGFKPTAIDIIEEKVDEISNKYSKYSLVEAANRIFYEYSLNCPNGTGNNIVTRYNPLYEPDLVGIGTSLSLTKRFNCNFYRKNIGKLNPSLADIPTFPFGHKLSNSLFYVLSDIYKLFMHAVIKTVNYGFRYTYNQSWNDAFLEHYVSKHQDATDALENLKDRGILAGHIKPSGVTPKFLTNALNVHYLMTE